MQSILCVKKKKIVKSLENFLKQCFVEGSQSKNQVLVSTSYQIQNSTDKKQDLATPYILFRRTTVSHQFKRFELDDPDDPAINDHYFGIATKGIVIKAYDKHHIGSAAHVSKIL